MAAFKSYIHRMLSIPLSMEGYRLELGVLYKLAISNGYDRVLVDTLIRRKMQHICNRQLYACPPDRVDKFVSSISYCGPVLVSVAKRLRGFGINVAFRTNNNVWRVLNGKDVVPGGGKSGVYRMCCDQCEAVYVGQTGRSFEVRYKEHVAAVRNDRPERSNFARHILDSGHGLSDSHHLEILHCCSKGLKLSVLEQLEILKHKNGDRRLLNEQLDVTGSSLLRLFCE